MTKILLDIALILLATKLGGLAARKLKLQEVLGALIAGLLIGPAVAGIVKLDENIKLLSDLGVIMLMFTAGIETDASQFKKAGKSSFLIALMGILLPLVLGTAGAFAFYNNVWENIFIGAILSATSVSITAETLNELGKLNSRSGINILGAAVIDDILGLIIISVLLPLAGKSGNMTGGALALKFTGIIVFCAAAIFAVALLPKYINIVFEKVPAGRTLLTLSIAAALIAAALAENLGIAGITGAYLFGLLISRLRCREGMLRGLKTISSGFLAPIFFASIGLEASFNGFGLTTLLIAAAMFVIAVIGKLVGCGAAARAAGLKRSEAVQVGSGMVSRGEVAVITANIGLGAGIISQEIFMPTIVVVILTTLVTPLLLRTAYSHKFIKTADREDAVK
jgi:Kef-type K+ transport system membrane component KefB